RLDRERFQTARQALDVTDQIVSFLRCDVRRCTLVIDRRDVLAHTLSAALIQDIRCTHRIGAENGGQRGVALLLCESTELRAELTGEGFHTYEITGRVVGTDAQLFHKSGGFIRRGL